MEIIDIAAIMFQAFVFSLIILFFVSFFLFIRRIRINRKKNAELHKEIAQKLDRIIELLEKH